MVVGLIGLGRMGQAIAARLVHAGISVVAYDKYAPEKVDLTLHSDHSAHMGQFTVVKTAVEVAQHARIVWLMIPQGAPLDEVVAELKPQLRKGDIIIDGGNSFYKDTVRRYDLLKNDGIHYLDCGTSGGLDGRTIGFCLMIGGDAEPVRACHTLFETVAAPKGFKHCGPSGAGHYVKMVHNGIEYGLLEAYAEGFQVLKENPHYPDLDLAVISDLWNHGSIIRSWILELAHRVYAHHNNFDAIGGEIGENLTGLWTYEEAQRHSIPVPVLKASLDVRAESRKTGGNYATKVVSLLRHEFGGHPITHISASSKDKELPS
jgi:6-phosphogluconate dehydrogenase